MTQNVSVVHHLLTFFGEEMKSITTLFCLIFTVSIYASDPANWLSSTVGEYYDFDGDCSEVSVEINRDHYIYNGESSDALVRLSIDGNTYKIGVDAKASDDKLVYKKSYIRGDNFQAMSRVEITLTKDLDSNDLTSVIIESFRHKMISPFKKPIEGSYGVIECSR